MTFTIRVAHEADVPMLAELHVQTFNETHRGGQPGGPSYELREHFGEAMNPSNGFYESFGAERLYTEKGEFHGGYGWRDLRTLVERCRG